MEKKPEVKVEPEGEKTGKTRTQPRFRIALGLAVALLLVTCAVAAGGLMMYFRGKCGNKRFTIKASVNGQTFTEEVEVDRVNGLVTYRDDVNTVDGEIIQTKEDSGEVPSFDVYQVVFLNQSVPVSSEDDVILRPQLPPVCHDATLYRAHEENARDYWEQEMDGGDSMETSYNSRVRRRVRRGARYCKIKFVNGDIVPVCTDPA